MNREQISIDELYVIALETISEVKGQDEFLVKDLFRDIDWRHIPIEKRMGLGAKILKYSECEEGENVIKAKTGENAKTPDGQQYYIKF